MTRTQARTLGAGLLLAALTVIAYAPALGGGFIFDDDNILTKNVLVKAADGLHRFWFTNQPVDYWPVTMTSFWVEWRLWGMSPAGYHWTNLLLHIGDALLLWAVLRRLRVPGAYVAGLLFAVHPVNVQSVAWIAERKNVLAIFFYLLSILFFTGCALSGPGEARAALKDRGCITLNRGYWLSLACFLLAMLSKGSIAFLPLVLLGIVAWRRRVRVGDVLRLLPFFAVAVAFTLINVGFQTRGLTAPIRIATPLQRLLEAGATVWFYLEKAVAPVGLTFVYPLWHIRASNPLWWIPLIAAAAVTAVLFKAGRLVPKPPPGALGSSHPNATRAALFAWLYFCVALIPVMGFADIYFMKYSLVADHYEYPALLGVAAAFAAACAALRMPRWAILALAGVLTVLTWRQARMYRSAEILYQETLRRNPGCWLADNNLGIIEANTGRLAAAWRHFETALALNPDYPEANFNLGLLLLPRPGGAAAAEERFARAVRYRPEYAEAHYYWGNSLRELGRSDDAIAQYEQALRYQPDFPDAELNLGTMLARAGRVAEALPHFQASVRMNPNSVQAQMDLAYALQAEGRPQEAMEHFTLAARLDPRLASPPP